MRDQETLRGVSIGSIIQYRDRQWQTFSDVLRGALVLEEGCGASIFSSSYKIRITSIYKFLSKYQTAQHVVVVVVNNNNNNNNNNKDVQFWENLQSTHHNQLLGYSTLWGSRWPSPPHTYACMHTHIICSEMLKTQNSRLCIIISTFTMGAKGLMIFKPHRFNVKCLAKCKQWTRVVAEGVAA